MEKETIMIDGVRYYADRPRSCRGCYFWKNRKTGCVLKKENCYYLAEAPKRKFPCEGCCYGPYRKLRDEAQELVIAESNLRSLFADIRSEEQHQQSQREDGTKQI